MNRIIGHLRTVNRHRWEVFKLCCKCSEPFRGLTHDLSKYSIEELRESFKYYKDGKCSPLKNCKSDIGYSRAWLHHKGRNKHHFEYWDDYTAKVQCPIIPYKYMVEMVCDRIAASKTYNKGNYSNDKPYAYYMSQADKMRIHPAMGKFLEIVFKRLSTEGESILNKKTLKSIYDDCIKKYGNKQFEGTK